MRLKPYLCARGVPVPLRSFKMQGYTVVYRYTQSVTVNRSLTVSNFRSYSVAQDDVASQILAYSRYQHNVLNKCTFRVLLVRIAHGRPP